MKDSFDDGELRQLAFSLFINYDDLRGDTLSERAIALVEHCEHMGRTAMLIDAIKRARPLVKL